MLEKIIIKSYDWDTDDTGSHVMIRSFGFNNQNENCLIRIEDYPMFFYLELPLRNYQGRLWCWDKYKVSSIFNDISRLCDVDKKPKDFTLQNLRKLYYFDNFTKYPMLRITFRTLKAASTCLRMFKKPFKTTNYGSIQLTVHENNIDIIRKFLTSRDITYSNWFECIGERVPDDEKISKCKNEYIIKWDSVKSIKFDIYKNWKTCPKFMAYDIECYSHNKKAMPKAQIASNVCWIISCVIYRLGDDDSKIKRIGILLGDSNQIPQNKIANCEIIKIKNFDEMILIDEFSKIIEKEDIDIITGYNILNFDFPYLAHRKAKCSEKWYECGRIDGEEVKYKDMSWESSGYGFNRIGMLKTTGRITIDLLPVIKRDYKLDKYTLDFVAKHFGIGKKNDVTPQRMFEIYENLKIINNKFKQLYLDILNLDDNNCDYDSVNNNYYDLIKEYRGDTCLEKYEDLYQEYLKEYEKDIENVTEVLEYCIVDSELVIKIIKKINLWDNMCELSNVLGVSIVDLTTRGQQIRCLSQLYHICTKQKPKIIINNREHLPMKFAGGYVGEPIPGVYENVLCFDFASLYPSIIQAYNICYTTLVHPDDNVTKDEDCYIVEFDQEEPIDVIENNKLLEDIPDYVNESDKYELFLDGEKKKSKTKIVHYRFRFYKKHEGILPALVRNLVAERRATIALKETLSDDDFMKINLNNKQLGLKISANSFFGFLGIANGGKAPLMEGAMSITALGRLLIGRVNDYLSEKYNAKVVYNDTDSSMVDIGITDRKQCEFWGIKIAKELSGTNAGNYDEDGNFCEVRKPGLFHHPVLKLEFEKAMRLFCIRKKKYFAFLINDDGNFKMKYDANKNKTDKYDSMKKGIVLARRDNFIYLREIYEKIILTIMERKGFKYTLIALIDSIESLYNKEIHYKKLSITKSLGANYKSSTASMKVFADEIRLDGKIATPGDRLEFVLVKKENEKHLGKKMKLIEQYEESLNSDNPYEIDYDYYVERGIRNCLTQIFKIAFQTELSKMETVHYKPIGNKNAIKINDIIDILINAKNELIPFNNIKEGIIACYDYFCTNDNLKLSYPIIKLHQYNNPKRIEYDMIYDEKQKQKLIKKEQPKKAIIKKILISKNQTKIERFFPVIKY